MNNDRLLSFLGLCKRAGALVSGAETVTKTIVEGKARLALYAADAAPNSLKAVRRAADEAKIPLLELDRSKEELSFALGKHCGIVCVTDKGFADKILELIRRNNHGYND